VGFWGKKDVVEEGVLCEEKGWGEHFLDGKGVAEVVLS